VIPTLIVDDESLLRSLVRNSVDWETVGFTIVGEAENGADALAFMEEHDIGLLVVDINMPIMNGLELSFLVKERYPTAKVLILTGYDEIDYVKQALRAGVADFILKPIDASLLRSSLEKICDGILAEAAKRSAEKASRPFAHEDEHLLKHVYIPSEATGSESAILSALMDRGILAPERNFAVLAARGSSRKAGRPEPERIAALISETQPEGRISDCFVASAERVLFILDAGGSEPDRFLREVRLASDASVCRAYEVGAFQLSAGLSAFHGHSAELGVACVEALVSLESTFHLGLGRTILFQGPPLATPRARRFDRNSFLLDLRAGNLTRCAAKVAEEFEWAKSTQLPPYLTRMLTFEIVAAILEYRNEIGNGMEEDGDVVSEVLELETRKEIQSYLERLLDAITAVPSDHSISRSTRIVQYVKERIEKEFARKDLCLEALADSVSVSPSYLSNVFKAHAGISIIEYLTERRLERAKRIMDEHPLELVYETAAKCGYSDPYYFSKAFKKRFGVSPTKYLERKC